MKRIYILSVITMVAGLIGILGMDASAEIKPTKVVNAGNTKATGGNGGKATGKNAKGGDGGAAKAKGGSIQVDKKGAVIKNSGNTEAKGGDGGNANGEGAVGGAGGAATAQGGTINVGTPKKNFPVDPGFPKGGNIIKGDEKKGPKKGDKKDEPKGDKKGDKKDDKKKDEPKAGGGGGGKAEVPGGPKAEGGKGGDATGPGSTGGAGGPATAIQGDGNTVINGNVTIVNNNITYTPGKGKGKGGKGGMGGGQGSGALSGLLGNLLGGIGGSGGGGGGFGGGDGGFAQGATDAGASQGAPGISTASSAAETVITNDGSPAIAQGANGKDNVEGDAEQIFTRRYLKVKNDSGVPMKVYVQYRGQDDKKWAWFPADPSESKDAIVHELAPGQEMYVQDKGTKLSASRVRIWGVADSQTWTDFRDEDLWVVPEMAQDGEHRYQATEMRTFTFVFPKQDKVAAN